MVYADAKLTADLNLLAYRSRLVPIGSTLSPYKGTFDGQGHKLQNIGSMLFGTTDGATIKNIGPGLELVGPSSNFSHFSDFSKLPYNL